MNLRDKIEEICERAIMDGGFGEEQAADAILSVIAESVKPLEWEREDDGSLTAESPFGLYAVYYDEGHGWLVILDGADDSWAKYPQDDFGFDKDIEAVSFCESDYTSRVLSALGLN